mgnify:CR=1 FL=1
MINGLHIELTNKCTLKCSGCSRTAFIEQFRTKWKNKDLDLDQLVNFLDLDLTGKLIRLCGTYGDPIYYTRLIELVKILKGRGANINITTNGSYRSADWWKELADNLTITDTVTFAIDGTSENFTKYRVNADWKSILLGINAIAKSSAKLDWQYILFSYNVDSVDEARDLSKTLGFDNFHIMESERWDKGTTWLTSKIDNLSLSKIKWKQEKDLAIDPKCNNGKQHYISADGYYAPCCYIAEHNFYYKSTFYKQKNVYDIVLMDLQMPEMNGLEVLRAIKKTTPKTFVFMLTAFISVELIQYAKRDGAEKIFSKFTPPDELIKEINDLLA